MAETVDRISCKAYAKINLCLRVLGKRPDGYHDIFSLMQAIDLCDDISFKRIDEEAIKIKCNDPDVPTGDDNLIARAFLAMKRKYSLSGGLDVRLHKRIPAGAGLGGGSSDCAAAIRAVDEIFQLSLTSSEMVQIGASLGSDVPFFFSSGSAVVTGRGDIVRNIKLPLSYFILLVVPKIHISTKAIYSKLKMNLTKKSSANRLKLYQDKIDMAKMKGLAGNDFQDIVFHGYPEVRKVKDSLSGWGLTNISISGTGSAVFAVAPKKEIEGCAIPELKNRGDWQVFITQPILLIGT